MKQGTAIGALLHTLLYDHIIEALYLPDSAAAAVIQLAATGAIDLITCEPVIREVENAILEELTKFPNRLDTVLKKWAVTVVCL